MEGTWSVRDTSPMVCRDRDCCFTRSEVVHRLFLWSCPPSSTSSRPLLTHFHRSAALTTAGWKCALRKARSGTGWEKKCGTWHMCWLGECEVFGLCGSAGRELNCTKVGVKLPMVHATPLQPFRPHIFTYYAHALYYAYPGRLWRTPSWCAESACSRLAPAAASTASWPTKWEHQRCACMH